MLASARRKLLVSCDSLPHANRKVCTRHVLLSQLKAHMLHELTARVVFASDSSVSAFGLFRGCHLLSLSTSLGLAAAASAEAGLQAVDEVADDC